ncbi:MAG: MFS transporter [Pseudothermotoga sp.]
MLSLCTIEALVYSAMACSSLMSQYFALLGFSPFQVGLLMALPPLTSIYANYIYFALASTFSIKRIVRIFSIGGVIALWSVFLFKGFAMKFLFMVALTFFQGSLLPLIESSMIEASHRLSFSYNKVRTWGTIGYTITAFITGRFIKFGFVWLFVVFSLIFVWTSFLSKNLKEMTTQDRKQKLELWKIPKVFVVLLSIITICIGFNLFNSVFLPIVVKERSYDPSIVGTTFSLMALSELPFLLNAERIRKRLSSKILFLSGCFVIGLRLILVSLSWSQTSLVLIQMLHGWTFIVIYYSTIRLMRENLKDQSLMSTQTFFWIALQGIGPLMGSTIGGVVVEKIGTSNAYMLFGVLCMVIAVYATYFFNKRFTTQRSL